MRQIMKTFKQYLIEAKDTYDFAIMIANCPEDCDEKIKAVLEPFECQTCSKGLTSPLSANHTDFPNHTNIAVTTFKVSLDYPATSEQIRIKVSDALDLSLDCVKVRDSNNQELDATEVDDKKSALLGKDYCKKENNQHLVGEKHTASFLKELEKLKNQGTQVKGVNDQLLATKLPKEKNIAITDKLGITSPVGSKKTKETKK